jgi:Xaa-Pro aminopeptidase
VGTDEIARAWPRVGHGIGLGLHERPIISRLTSHENPIEPQAVMVFAPETSCPASDGYSAARIEEVVLVPDGPPQVITRFPAQELFVATPC